MRSGNDPRGQHAGAAFAGSVVHAGGRCGPAHGLRMRRSRRRRWRHRGTVRRTGMTRRIGMALRRRWQFARRLAGSRKRSHYRDRWCSCSGLVGWRSWRHSWCGSFGLHRRRDVFDGCTVGGAAAHAQRDETNGRHLCGSGVADRPSGHAIAACRAGAARTLRQPPLCTVRASVRTLAGPIPTAWRMTLLPTACAADSSPQRTQTCVRTNQEHRHGPSVRTGSATRRRSNAA
jgi:hypothetical protein